MYKAVLKECIAWVFVCAFVHSLYLLKYFIFESLLTLFRAFLSTKYDQQYSGTLVSIFEIYKKNRSYKTVV